MSVEIRKYLTDGTLRKEVQDAIEQYEQFTDIDEYMQHSGKTWFYEYTIQGFIYSRLAFKYDIGFKPTNEYLMFLEEPYSANSSENRCDILFVPVSDASRKNSSAIELKTDFEYGSIRTDMEVMARYLREEKIQYGYGIFFADSQQTIDSWVTDLKAVKELKPFFQSKQLFAVGMVGAPK